MWVVYPHWPIHQIKELHPESLKRAIGFESERNFIKKIYIYVYIIFFYAFNVNEMYII